MKTISTFTISALIGLSMLGCKPIVNELAFYPDNVNVISANKLPDGIQELTVNTDDNVKLISLFLPSTESKKLLIYFHGNAGNIYHRIPSLLQLHSFGVNVIGVSYRGYGKSEGDPGEEGIYLDGKAIYQHAVQRMGFSKENIILFGRSIGTTVAINISQNKDIRGIILVTPLTSGSDMAEAIGLGSVASLAEGSFDNMAKVGSIKSPLLVIHGTSDRIIPYSMGREIFDRANVKKEFVKIDGANHNNLHDVY
ncbi:MAG: alpha/beta hydrolase, partial [Gammaproteobacteria bacterium]|nr:alpha/beta hydrolase [Gammaproteobacteria bacterium]